MRLQSQLTVRKSRPGRYLPQQQEALYWRMFTLYLISVSSYYFFCSFCCVGSLYLYLTKASDQLVQRSVGTPGSRHAEGTEISVFIISPTLLFGASYKWWNPKISTSTVMKTEVLSPTNVFIQTYIFMIPSFFGIWLFQNGCEIRGIFRNVDDRLN